MSKKAVEWDPTDYIDQVVQENDERLRAKLKEQGRSPYLRLVKGENTFTLLRRKPNSRLSNFGKDQAVFAVEQGGTEYEWPVTKTSPMFVKVAGMLGGAPCEVTIIRTGEGVGTRLDLK